MRGGEEPDHGEFQSMVAIPIATIILSEIKQYDNWFSILLSFLLM